jgi:hypothetical protein
MGRGGKEQAMLKAAGEIAYGARKFGLDAKILRLIEWIRHNLCPDMPPIDGQGRGASLPDGVEKKVA